MSKYVISFVIAILFIFTIASPCFSFEPQSFSSDFDKISTIFRCKIDRVKTAFTMLLIAVWVVAILGVLSALCQTPVKRQGLKTSLKIVTAVFGILIALFTMFCDKVTDVGYKEFPDRIFKAEYEIWKLQELVRQGGNVTPDDIIRLNEYFTEILPKIFIPDFILLRFIPDACAQEVSKDKFSPDEQKKVNAYFGDYFKNRPEDNSNFKAMQEAERKRAMEILKQNGIKYQIQPQTQIQD